MPEADVAELLRAAERATQDAAASAVTAAGWDEAVRAWEAARAALEQISLAETVRAVLLDRAAGVRLRRSRCGGADAAQDAAAAAGLNRQAAALVPVGAPDRRAYLNNRGVALRRQLECGGSAELLDEAIAAHEAAVSESAADTPDGVACRLQLGTALRERSRLSTGREDLVAAVGAFSDALRGAAALGSVERAECHEALGNALHDLAPDRLDAAIGHLRAALELLPDDDDDRAGYVANLGSAVLTKFELGGDPAELDQAIALSQDALARRDATGEPSAELLANLGNALIVRSALRGEPDEADRAVAYLRRAAGRAASTPQLPAMQSNLAAALLERFDLIGQIADVEESIGLLEDALAATPPGAAERAPRLSNLAIALRLRQLRRRDGHEDIERAIAAYEEALETAPPEEPDRIAYRANLGNAIHQRFDVTGDGADLERAVRELEAAVAMTPHDSPDRPMYLNNLSGTLAANAERLDRPDDLRRAAVLVTEGLTACPGTSVHRPGMLVNLGNARAELFDRLRDPDDRAAARAAYRAAARTGVKVNPADGLFAARNWAEWAARRRAWAEVIAAYGYGERAGQRLFRTQLGRADKESWIRDAEGLAATGAFARARRSNLRGAVVALESGRAMLYSERLERERADLRRLRHEHEHLVRRYRQAAARIDRLQRAEGDRRERRARAGAEGRVALTRAGGGSPSASGDSNPDPPGPSPS